MQSPAPLRHGRWLGRGATGTMVELADECALKLAEKEKDNSQCTPAVIIQSSGTPSCSSFRCITTPSTTLPTAESGLLGKSPHAPPSHIQPSVLAGLLSHAVSAHRHQNPTRISLYSQLCSHQQFIACATAYIREIPPSALKTYAPFLQTLCTITVYGSVVDEAMSAQWEANKLPIAASRSSRPTKLTLSQNLFGMSELGRLFYSRRAPYTISEPNPDGSRQVQL
ncbi:AMP-binding enzyme [Ceratobasidium theobromae]|uniref:AMP-binding enzyme n=1 Tax=Ceratobasidium theobromae TaxID=1582974 RepID=A0A5N5QE63_9AGAM|nr:AMP-binding enzyme [Ceratobasidium theobromae]